MPYADHTRVPVERSRVEIERILQRYGAEEFMYATRKDAAMVQFILNDRRVKLTILIPDPEPKEIRRRWRVLVLTLKAKLEAVESGNSTFEEEFLAHIVIPGIDKTIGEIAIPKIEAAYQGKTVNLLDFK